MKILIYLCDKGTRGWYCLRQENHSGPCALQPVWWRHPIIWWTWH